MTTAVASRTRSVARLPPLARLGFDYGWLFLSPRFLKLGQPCLLVDRQLVGDLHGLGLEPFGRRDPQQPFTTTKIVVRVRGRQLSLWAAPRSTPSLLAVADVDTESPDTTYLARAVCFMLLVGDTYTVQLSWSALWTCDVGLAMVDQPDTCGTALG